MNLLSLTYRITPEKQGGFSVVCLDWSAVYTQGASIAECKKNAIEVTEMMIELLNSGSLDRLIHPKIKKNKAHPMNFQLTFDLDKSKHITISTLSKQSRLSYNEK
ncbi:MAG: type II toxin-antitoxin system HicB family antitoxin [Bacteroidota bacterium]